MLLQVVGNMTELLDIDLDMFKWAQFLFPLPGKFLSLPCSPAFVYES